VRENAFKGFGRGLLCFGCFSFVLFEKQTKSQQIDAGEFDGWTYGEIEQKFPEGLLFEFSFAFI
jgi:hypothetical protein